MRKRALSVLVTLRVYAGYSVRMRRFSMTAAVYGNVHNVGYQVPLGYIIIYVESHRVGALACLSILITLNAYRVMNTRLLAIAV
jgi:hypothetical protein